MLIVYDRYAVCVHGDLKALLRVTSMQCWCGHRLSSVDVAGLG